MGVGPKIGLIVLPYLAVAIALTIIFPSIFKFPASFKIYLLVAGIVFLAVGLILYGFTARSLLTGLKQTRLMTTGMFRYCQNPLYSVLMLLIFPSIAFLTNSWIILTTTIIGYLVFKMYINQEYEELTEVFGEEYKRYKERTPEFFPFGK